MRSRCPSQVLSSWHEGLHRWRRRGRRSHRNPACRLGRRGERAGPWRDAGGPACPWLALEGGRRAALGPRLRAVERCARTRAAGSRDHCGQGAGDRRPCRSGRAAARALDRRVAGHERRAVVVHARSRQHRSRRRGRQSDPSVACHRLRRASQCRDRNAGRRGAQERHGPDHRRAGRQRLRRVSQPFTLCWRPQASA